MNLEKEIEKIIDNSKQITPLMAQVKYISEDLLIVNKKTLAHSISSYLKDHIKELVEIDKEQITQLVITYEKDLLNILKQANPIKLRREK